MAFDTLCVRTSDGTELCVGAQPCGGEGPLLLILHGLFSHMGWYRSLAEEMSALGASVYLLDRRGAGLSQGTRGHMPNWPTLVRDVEAVAQAIRSRHPGRPLHCLGISLGATIGLAASIRHPELFASHILLAPGLAAGFPVPLRKRLRLLRGFLLRPRQLFDLPFAVKTLTDHPRWQEALAADPLRTHQVTARFLVETFRMQRFVRTRMPAVRAPLFALLAAKDQLVDNKVAIASLRRAGSHRVRIEVFEGASHILPAAVPGAELLQRFAHWLHQPGPKAREELSIVSVPPFAAGGDNAFDPPVLAALREEAKR